MNTFNAILYVYIGTKFINIFMFIYFMLTNSIQVGLVLTEVQKLISIAR